MINSFINAFTPYKQYGDDIMLLRTTEKRSWAPISDRNVETLKDILINATQFLTECGFEKTNKIDRQNPILVFNEEFGCIRHIGIFPGNYKIEFPYKNAEYDTKNIVKIAIDGVYPFIKCLDNQGLPDYVDLFNRQDANKYQLYKIPDDIFIKILNKMNLKNHLKQ